MKPLQTGSITKSNQPDTYIMNGECIGSTSSLLRKQKCMKKQDYFILNEDIIMKQAMEFKWWKCMLMKYRTSLLLTINSKPITY
jgi:hypothetical protein